MNEIQKQYSSSLEINDLIDDAVDNAVARRSDLTESENELSDEESTKVAGGSMPWHTMGYFPVQY
jgi:hypothetical protein